MVVSLPKLLLNLTNELALPLLFSINNISSPKLLPKRIVASLLVVVVVIPVPVISAVNILSYPFDESAVVSLYLKPIINLPVVGKVIFGICNLSVPSTLTPFVVLIFDVGNAEPFFAKQVLLLVTVSVIVVELAKSYLRTYVILSILMLFPELKEYDEDDDDDYEEIL